MAHDVFISFSTADKLTADAVCHGLEAAGIRCWISSRDIPPGMDFGEAITLGLEGCRIMVLIFSAQANASKYVIKEVTLAVGEGLTIIPFRIENVLASGALKYHLSNPNWLDALDEPLAAHITELREAITRYLALSQPTSSRTQIFPPQVLVKHHTIADDFDELYAYNRKFLTGDNLRKMAAAITDYYDGCYQVNYFKRTLDEVIHAFETTAIRSDPWIQWMVESNIAAARRLPHLLALAGLQLKQGVASNDEVNEVVEHLKKHIDLLASAEHTLWMQFLLENGWQQADDGKLKKLNLLRKEDEEKYRREIKRLKIEERIHTMMVPFDKLSELDIVKDQDFIINYPKIVALLGWRITFMHKSISE